MIYNLSCGSGKSKPIWFVTEQQAQEFGITHEGETTIGFGAARANLMIVVVGDRAGDFTVSMSKGAFGRLCMPKGVTLCLNKTDWGFRLGPLIGVMVNQPTIDKAIKGQPLGGLELLWQASKKEGVFLYIFHPRGVDFQRKTIRGYSYEAPGKPWQGLQVPFPDVLYDRAVFSVEEKPLGKKVRNSFKISESIFLINEKHYYGKWETYKCFSLKPSLKSHLPLMVIHHGLLDIDRMCRKYPRVFLKSDYGSRGKEIVQVERQSEGRYKFRYDEQGASRTVTGSSGVINRLPLGKQKLLLQQGIGLARYRGRSFDIRSLAQKDDGGRWVVTGSVARIRGPGKVTTNVSSGGKALSLPSVLSEVFPQKRKDILRKLNKLVIKACLTLEEEFGAQGELGFDLALDRDGYLWLIEVNGKPAKSSLEIFRYKDSVLERAYKKPLQYARFIAGFSGLDSGGE